MSSTAARHPAARAEVPSRAFAARDAAWLAALPVAALTLLLVLTLGPVVGDILLPRSSVEFFEITRLTGLLNPEPAEQGRFVVALTGPLLLAGATLLLARRPQPLPAKAVELLVWGAQAAVVAFAAACLVIQWGIRYGPEYQSPELVRQRYFTGVTVAVAVLGAAALVAATRSARVRELTARWTRDTPVRRIGWTLAAVLLAGVWLLHVFNTEGTIAYQNGAAAYHLQFTLDETFAVLNGRTPLVDFVAQYGSLWPYPVAGAMSLLGPSVGTFSALMCILTGVALLAMFDVLRRVTRSALTAFLLFAPFVATSFFMLRGPLENRYTLATIFADYPLRFAGPWLLCWMTMRHLDGARPRAVWPLFLVGGLTVMNNTDHGFPAVAAVLAALLWTGGRLSWPRLRSLAVQAGAGLLGAVVIVSALTLVRAGALPDPSFMFRFAKLFASEGFGMLPMPAFGLHTILYVTFAGALATATVRAIANDPDRVLTGALAFSAIFGLASGTYYAGRSHPEVLVTSFAIWSFTLALLTLVAMRRLAVARSPWYEPAAIATLVGFAVTVCSLAQTPTPWSQIDRLSTTTEPVFRAPPGQEFVAEHVRRGERVLVLHNLGHRTAENLGVMNVNPYTGAAAMPSIPQLDDAVRALRREGGHKMFFSTQSSIVPYAIPLLEASGFRRAAADGGGNEMWVDG